MSYRDDRHFDSETESRKTNPMTKKTTIEREDWRIQEANRRLGLLEAFDALLQQGMSPRQAAKRLRENRVTLWRYQKKFESGGYEGLIPSTKNCGRKPLAEKLQLTAEEIAQVQGLNLDTASNTAAWRLFASSDRCRPEVAAVILDPAKRSKHSIPPSLFDATKVNENLRQAHRGPRRLGLKGMWTPRKMDILPGDIFTADDTTPIWAWWVPWVECEEYPYGVKLLQGQFLPVMDVASQCVLCFVLIAREKSSYRAADIWHLFGHTFDTVGLPRLGWQLERGSWEANVIRGQEIEYQEGEFTHSRRVGGLRQLPTNVTDWHRAKLGTPLPGPLPSEGRGNDKFVFPQTLQTWTSYLPKSKSIEALFNRSQTLEGTIWGCLGRDQMRNPFEKTKKIYEACKRGAADPRQHFLDQREMLQQLSDRLKYLNSERMEGEVFRGIPQQIFDQAVSERPLKRMPDELEYLYRRDWKAVRITQGWARVRLTHEIDGSRYSLFYTNERVFAEHEGEEIAVYYDREEFEKPAQVHLARTGEFLCEAHYEDRRGSFLDGDRSGHDVRKAWRNAVMSAYATIVKYAPSRQVPAELEARRAAAKETPLSPALSPQRGEGEERLVTSSSTIADGRPRPTRAGAEEPAYKGSLRFQQLTADV